MEELDQNIDSIIFRQLVNETTDDEKSYLLDWIKKDIENQKYYFNLKEIWEASQANFENYKTDEYWLKLNEVLTNKKEENSIRKSRFIPLLIKYAAFALIIIAVGIISYKYGSKLLNRDVPETYTEIKTPDGQKKEIILSDGTQVWLNSGSFLKYKNSYGQINREVYLTGEAYFNVTKDKTKTFIVKTDNITIKVLGTSFNVKCYPELKTVETTVITGIVSLEDNKTEKKDVVILNKREKATYLIDMQKMYISRNSTNDDAKKEVSPIELKKISLSEEEAEYIASWKDQTLSFNNETFEELAFKLQRWFNVKIIIKDEKLKNYRYKGKFDNIKSIFQVLEVVKLTTPISYDFNEKTKEITIKENKNE